MDCAHSMFMVNAGWTDGLRLLVVRVYSSLSIQRKKKPTP